MFICPIRFRGVNFQLNFTENSPTKIKEKMLKGSKRWVRNTNLDILLAQPLLKIYQDKSHFIISIITCWFAASKKKVMYLSFQLVSFLRNIFKIMYIVKLTLMHYSFSLSEKVVTWMNFPTSYEIRKYIFPLLIFIYECVFIWKFIWSCFILFTECDHPMFY